MCFQTEKPKHFPSGRSRAAVTFGLRQEQDMDEAPLDSYMRSHFKWLKQDNFTHPFEFLAEQRFIENSLGYHSRKVKAEAAFH